MNSNLEEGRRPRKSFSKNKESNRKNVNTESRISVATESVEQATEDDREREMKRDREYRLLNEKLREKEYRIREMEAAKLQQDELATKLAEKVEKEILQKLASTTGLSNLLKNNGEMSGSEIHRNLNEKSRQKNIEPKRVNNEKKQTNTRQSRNILDSKGEMKEESTGNQPKTNQTVSASESVRGRRGGGGGVIRVPWLNKDKDVPTMSAQNSIEHNLRLTSISSNKSSETGAISRSGTTSGGPRNLLQPSESQSSTVSTSEQLLKQQQLQHQKQLQLQLQKQQQQQQQQSKLNQPNIQTLQQERQNISLKIKQLESTYQKKIEEIKRDKNNLIAYCTLGPSNGAPELHHTVLELEAHYFELVSSSTSTSSLNMTDILISTLSTGIANKLWLLYFRQIELFLSILNPKIANNHAIPSNSMMTIKQIFFIELQRTETNLLKMVAYFKIFLTHQQQLQVKMDPSQLDGENNNKLSPWMLTICESLQCLYIGLGEINKYKIIHCQEIINTSTTVSERSSSSDIAVEAGGGWDVSLGYFKEAATIAYWNGTGRKCVASITRLLPSSDSSMFLTVYHLCRSMSVQNPYAAREGLLGLLERIKLSAEELESVTALSMLPVEQHRLRFQKHFLSALGIAYSRTGADRFASHLERTKRHLATLLQMCTVEAGSGRRGGGASQGAYYQVKKLNPTLASSNSANTTDITTSSTIITPIIRDVAEDCRQAILMCLSVTYVISEKHSLKQNVANCRWTDNLNYNPESAVTTTTDDVNVPSAFDEETYIEEYNMKLKRYASQSLHIVQSVPGVLDMMRLTQNLICTLLDISTTLSGTSNSQNQFQYSSSLLDDKKQYSSLYLTIDTIAIFLDWFLTNFEFHSLPIIDRITWQQLESKLDFYLLHAIGNVKASPGIQDRLMLADDVDLSGYLPTRESKYYRYFHDRLLPANVSNTSSSLDASISPPPPPPLHEPKSESLSWKKEDVRVLQIYCLRVKKLVHTLVRQNATLGLPDGGLAFLASNRQITPAIVINPSNDTNEDSAGSGSVSVSDDYNVILVKLLTLPKWGLGPVAAKLTDKVTITPSYDPTVSTKLLTEEEFRLSMGLGSKKNKKQINPVVVSNEAESNTNATISLESGTNNNNNSGGSGEVEEEGVEDEPSEARRDRDGEDERYSDDSSSGSSDKEDEDDDDDEEIVFKGANEINKSSVLPPAPLPSPSTLIVDSPSMATATATAATERGGLLRITNMSDVINSNSNSNSNQNNPSSGKHNNGRKSSTYQSPSHSSSNTTTTSTMNQRSGGTSYPPPPLSLSFRPTDSSLQLPLIVVDAPNVAMRHGLNQQFSCLGIQLALEFFHRAGHKVISFLPDYYLNFEDVNGKRNQARIDMNKDKARSSRIPDDIPMLLNLVSRGWIIGTPSQDYDDSYCITYARRHDGYVITNDMYRDHVKRIEVKSVREDTKKWIKGHCISYTFVGNEFLPNPDADFNNSSSTSSSQGNNNATTTGSGKISKKPPSVTAGNNRR